MYRLTGYRLYISLCHLVPYITYVARSCSSWYVLLFTTERFIAVKFPLKVASLVTRRRMRLVLLMLTTLVCISQVYFFVVLEAVNTRGGWVCILTSNYYEEIKFAMRECVGFLVPAAITAVLNVWIIITLRQWTAQQSGLKGDSENKDIIKKKKNAEYVSMTVMLVTVSMFSVLVYAPRSITQLYYGIRDESSVEGSTVAYISTSFGMFNLQL